MKTILFLTNQNGKIHVLATQKWNMGTVVGINWEPVRVAR